MRARTVGIALVGALTLGGAALLWWASQSRGQGARSPAYVPMGETVERVLPSEEGAERSWTLRKQQIALDELPDRALPSPAPRSSEPDERTESARTLDALALDAWRNGDFRRAVELFERAVATDPDDAIPRSNYGRLLVLALDYPRALAQLERAAELAPHDPQVWLDLQTAYERSVLLERASYARRRAASLAAGRRIVKDERGFYLLDGTEFP